MRWAQGWAIGVAYTGEPHRRNFYGEMWGNPMFDLRGTPPAHDSRLIASAERLHRTYIRGERFRRGAGLRDEPDCRSCNRTAGEAGFL